ncbi:hypothetical protein QR680_007933 [Steinernema hermaphroditum]|uniref:Uncharacterized protein n=1 Tax=Steinernema hermaphroditum TaxID=289476 RepID=A0AA39M769_9BILA|nr:hypothetical protein QR680_007933 [Steinernema hermaphroditum]
MCARSYVARRKWLLWVLALISALSVVAFLVLTLYDIGWTYSYKNHGVHPKKGWEIALLVLSVGISLAGIVIHLLIFLSLRLGSNWRRGHFVIIVFLVFQVYMMARMIILLYVGSRTIAERKGTKADPFAVVLIVFGTLFFINDVISFLFFVTHFRILKQEVHERECEEAAQEDQRSECTSEPGGRSRKATETPFEDTPVFACGLVIHILTFIAMWRGRKWHIRCYVAFLYYLLQAYIVTEGVH